MKFTTSYLPCMSAVSALPSALVKATLAVALCACAVSPVFADDDDGEGESSWFHWGRSSQPGGGKEGGMTGSAPPQYKQECGSCHMVYPAGLLPVAAWQQIMAKLGQHFGQDASLDATSAGVISQYLTSHGGTYKRAGEIPPQNRITQSSWFLREHDRHVSASTWSRASVGGRGNCVACHSGAEQGNFSEHSVRIPG